MRPVVDRLQVTYTGQVAFRFMNVLDGGNGQAVFGQLALRGHPSYVIFAPDGVEAFRTFGVIEESTLQEAVNKVLDSS